MFAAVSIREIQVKRGASMSRVYEEAIKIAGLTSAPIRVQFKKRAVLVRPEDDVDRLVSAHYAYHRK